MSTQSLYKVGDKVSATHNLYSHSSMTGCQCFAEKHDKLVILKVRDCNDPKTGFSTYTVRHVDYDESDGSFWVVSNEIRPTGLTELHEKYIRIATGY